LRSSTAEPLCSSKKLNTTLCPPLHEGPTCTTCAAAVQHNAQSVRIPKHEVRISTDGSWQLIKSLVDAVRCSFSILILTSFGECRIGFGIHSSDYGLRAADTDPKHEWRILYG